MRIYHNELIQRIDELGSDGQALFPYEKLEWHMKKYAKFGLGSFIFYNIIRYTFFAQCIQTNSQGLQLKDFI